MALQTVCVVGLVYRSVEYLRFMNDQLSRYAHAEAWSVSRLIVGNDPTPEVAHLLSAIGGDVAIYRDSRPDDYWLNRVYRAWNFAGRLAAQRAQVIAFVNSDMAFSPHWLDALLRELTPETIPVSRLVESGKLLSGDHAHSWNFGRRPSEYDEAGFLAWCDAHREPRTAEGGLYMPVAFHSQCFLDSGGFPEGNLYEAGFGAHESPFVMSGDRWFFSRNPVMGRKRHVTVFDSIAYHIQGGEMDEP